MCQDRLSKDPLQEDLPVWSPTGCTGTGSGDTGRTTAACLLPPTSPQQIWPERAHLFRPLEKSLFSKHRFSPTPLSSGNSHRARNASWKPFVQPSPPPALLGAAPAARSRCCRAWKPFHPPNSCLHFAWALLHTAAPSQVTAHRFSCAIYSPDVPWLNRMVSEHCHPTTIVMNHVSRPHGAGYLLVAGKPPPFSTDAGSYPTDSHNARCVTADLSRGWSGHGAGT